MDDSRTLGQVGFDAYGEHASWKAYDGKDMPRWDDKLRTDIKEKWEVAASAIAARAVKDAAPAIVDGYKDGLRNAAKAALANGAADGIPLTEFLEKLIGHFGG